MKIKNTKETMKYAEMIVAIMVATMLAASCKNDRPAQNPNVMDVQMGNDVQLSDSTIYGTCGENTAMHTLELIGDDGKTHSFIINQDDSTSFVQGGLLTGDRLAVIARVSYGDTIACNVINLTTLQGKWSSLDKDFEIKEGGLVQSNVEAESNPWTSWKIFNGHLILNADTFDIVELGADSLWMENAKGLFGYKRIKK